ncbi:MAG: DUF4783 domain-containing protein [Saprospiraceae bacterium]|nr:DUF4783 domain-containing protein [Saprospiraceae bacterium]
MKMLTFVMLSAFFVPLEAQTVKTALDAIVRNDKEYFNKYFAPQITFIIDQEEQTVSKEQAIEKIKAFVMASNIRSNKIIHEGITKGRDAYMGIGSLIADKTKFRVYISYKNMDGNQLIHELKFEKDIL